MNIIKTEDGTFDINVHQDELAIIMMWSCIELEHFDTIREQFQDGYYADELRTLFNSVYNHATSRGNQSEIFRRLRGEIGELVDRGDIRAIN